MSYTAPDFTTCTCGKRSYHARRDAASVRRGHRQRRHMGIYRCPQSGAWHVTYCWVCRRTLTDAESAARDKTGCGPQCQEPA